jgi:hypothetical protein
MPPVAELGLFLALSLVTVLYGLAVAGHFPAEARRPSLREPLGASILWGSLIVALAAAITAATFGWRRLPIAAAVIGFGAMGLMAPIVLKPLPDSFVDGRRGLLVLSGVAAALMALAWRWL